MAVLCAGVILWMGVHLMPAMLPSNKKALVTKLGLKRYMLLFTLLIFTSVFLIVNGWQSATPEFLYHISFARHLTYLLVFVSIVFLVASKVKSKLGALVRHPQLMSIFFWSAGHLLVNGDSRSVVLFGGMLIWSVLEMLFINRRDGEWQKQPVQGFKGDILVLVVSVVIVAVLMFAHPFLAGVHIMRPIV